MPQSPTWLIKRCAEFVHRDETGKIPMRTRGVYALLNRRSQRFYDVIYVGMASGGIRGRLVAHKKGKKGNQWTHFSAYEVHDNITAVQIAEIEGLLRHIYRKDAKANKYNVQGQHRPIRQVRAKLDSWDWEYY